MVNYQEGKIYKLVSNNTDKIYIGSTCQRLSKRISQHREYYNKYLKGEFHYLTSFELVKYDDCKIYLIERYPCEISEELESREGYFIKKFRDEGICVNKYIAGQTDKQYYQLNKDHIIEKSKKYYENNRESVLERVKKYNENNKQLIVERKKIYRQKNKDKIKERKSEIVKCECGSEITICHKARHERTKKHLDFVNSQQ